MSLKVKYFSLVFLVHAALGVTLYLYFADQKWWFLCSEVLLIISLACFTILYRSINYPFQLMKSGKSTLLDEDFTIKLNKTGTKELDELIVVYNGMIDRLRKEKTRTEEQSYFLEDLIEYSPLGMLIMDYEKVIVIANRRAKQIMNLDDLTDKMLSDIDHPLALEIAEMDSFQEKMITIDGIKKYKCKLHQLIHKGFPRQFVIIEELTGEMLEVEKQAYGKVIRMMAHEVNNSMGAVNSILENVKEYGLANEDKEENEEFLQLAIDRNSRLAQFTNNFAEFIRLPKPLFVKLDLNNLVMQLADYMTLAANERNIRFDMRTFPEPIIVPLDKIQMEQVISNIIKNAFESIDRDGIVRITTQPEKPQLVISDNGKGISAEAAANLFSPFYSTKKDGQGIGLMLIRDILNNHGAEYRLYTADDNWTKFEISFTA